MVDLNKRPLVSQKLESLLVLKLVTQKALAAACGTSIVQVNRWLKGTERIPFLFLPTIGDRLGLDAGERAMLRALNEIHCQGLDLSQNVGNRLKRAAKARGLKEKDEVAAMSEELSESVIELITSITPVYPEDDVLTQCSVLTTRLEYFSRVAAAVSWIEGAMLGLRPLISPDNFAEHLVFPYNVIVSHMITIDDDDAIWRGEGIRRTVLDSFRESVLLDPGKNWFHYISSQHALHMLARHGDDDDFDVVDRILKTSQNDIHTQRMAAYGIIRSTRDLAAIDRYIHRFNSDYAFALSTVVFDAVHYGDARLRDGKYPMDCTEFPKSVDKILMHLQHRTGIDYVEIGMAKLVFILENFGKSSFAKPGIHRRLRAVLDRMEGEPDRANHVRFERTFRELVNSEASAWGASTFVPSAAAAKANM